jgi:hypothetical protein
MQVDDGPRRRVLVARTSGFLAGTPTFCQGGGPGCVYGNRDSGAVLNRRVGASEPDSLLLRPGSLCRLSSGRGVASPARPLSR